MALIYETENFILESHENPEVDRLEWGHMKISPKVSVEDRTFLTPRQAIELMRFTIASGEVMKRAMAKIGVHIWRINYQDNGNWRPELHVHLYGRAIDATMQKYGEPIIPGYRDHYNPLSHDDIIRMREELEMIFQSEEFSDTTWWV